MNKTVPTLACLLPLSAYSEARFNPLSHRTDSTDRQNQPNVILIYADKGSLWDAEHLVRLLREKQVNLRRQK